MTRKRKIGFAVAAIALVAVAIGFFSGGEEGEITITYAGIASNDPRHVSFLLSNGFPYEIFCSCETWEPFHDDWQPMTGTSYRELGYLPSRCTTNFTVTVPSATRWRVEVNAVKPLPDNIITDWRLKILRLNIEHRGPDLGGLLLMGYVLKGTNSPEMLGNKPAPELPP
jgi:hypothetical protein